MKHILTLAFGITVALGGAAQGEDLKTATFAGGCFWCVESDFDKVPGVVETVSGYTGGDLDNPTYEQVTLQDTGHYEAVQITYDADVVSYERLLEVFWRSVDPTDAGGQFCDRGPSYRTAVFAETTEEAATAKSTRQDAMDDLGMEIATPVLEASTFWPAEDYHQNYHNKNPLKYKFYRTTCGRDRRVRQLWGDQARAGT